MLNVLNKTAIWLGVILGVAACGVALSLALTFLGGWLLDDVDFGFGGLGLVLLGILLSYPLGVSLGIILLDKKLNYRGWILAGITGTVLGGLLLVVLAETVNLNLYLDVMWILFVLLPPLLGVIGFHIPKPGR